MHQLWEGRGISNEVLSSASNDNPWVFEAFSILLCAFGGELPLWLTGCLCWSSLSLLIEWSAHHMMKQGLLTPQSVLFRINACFACLDGKIGMIIDLDLRTFQRKGGSLGLYWFYSQWFDHEDILGFTPVLLLWSLSVGLSNKQITFNTTRGIWPCVTKHLQIDVFAKG